MMLLLMFNSHKLIHSHRFQALPQIFTITHWQIVSVDKDVIASNIHSVPGQGQTQLVGR